MTHGIKVKPLDWKWHRDPKDTSEARTTIGAWTVWEINGSGYCYGPDDTCGKPCDGGIHGAKAFAQADYERRILAALDLSEAGFAADRIEALEAALEKADALSRAIQCAIYSPEEIDDEMTDRVDASLADYRAAREATKCAR